MTPERIKQIEAMLAEGDISTFGSDTVSCLEYVDVDRYADLESIVRELLAALSETDKWISVSERLPEVSAECPLGDIVIGYQGDRVYSLHRYHFRKGWQYCPEIKGWPSPKVTHWMPLPAPPAVHETEKEGM